MGSQRVSLTHIEIEEIINALAFHEDEVFAIDEDGDHDEAEEERLWKANRSAFKKMHRALDALGGWRNR